MSVIFVRTSQAHDASTEESTDRMVPGVFLLAQVCRSLLGEFVGTTGESFREREMDTVSETDLSAWSRGSAQSD